MKLDDAEMQMEVAASVPAIYVWDWEESWFLSNCKKWSEVKWVPQSCLTLCDPIDCSLQGSSVHGIFQARVLDWVVTSFSRGSSRPRDRTWASHIAGRCFTIWATREAPLIAKRDSQILEEEAVTKLKIYMRGTLKISQWRTLSSLGP